mgnify:CR=1 FL=1
MANVSNADAADVGAPGRSLHDVALGGICMVLGGGHNGFADLLGHAGLLDGDAIAGYVYLDVDPAAAALGVSPLDARRGTASRRCRSR